jgi:hypothetical protein
MAPGWLRAANYLEANQMIELIVVKILPCSKKG